MEDENRKVVDDEENRKVMETRKDKDKETKSSTIKEGKPANEGDNLTYLEDSRNQTDEVTNKEKTRNQTDEVTNMEETRNQTDEVTYLEDTKNQADEHVTSNMSVTIEHRLESKETKNDDAAIDLMSEGNSVKENETAELVNYPLSPISKSSRGEEDLYLNENDEGKELEKITILSNSSEHSQTNQMHTSPIQSEKKTSEGVNRDFEDRKATVSPSGDGTRPPMKIISNVSDTEKLEVDDKDEQSSLTSSHDSPSEFRFASENGEKGKDVHKFNESYDKLSPEHGELQQQEEEVGTNNNKDEVGKNNSSSNKDGELQERPEPTAEMSQEQDTFPSEGISIQSDYIGQKLQNFSDQQKIEPMEEKKDIKEPINGNPYSKNSEKDKKSLVKDARLELAIKRKNSQIQLRNNSKAQSKSSSQIQSGSGIQSHLKNNFINNEKQTSNTGLTVSTRNVQSNRCSSRNSRTFQRSNESTLSGREIVNRRRMTKSATSTLLQMKTRPETRTSRPYSQARIEVSQDGKKRQEFFRLELRRIKTGLEKEASKIKRPKERDYYPFVWTSLAPYYDTTTAQYLIPLDKEEDKDKEQKDGKEEVTDEKHAKKRNPEMEKLAYEKSIRAYLTRNTAIGLCDPWVDLNMDKRFLEFPKIETPEEKQKKQAEEASKGSSAEKGEKAKKTRPPKEGSTRLPKFPVITLDKKELATKPLHYNDVPMLRSEFEASFSLKSKERMRKDYKRTKEDFYRMELDRLNEIHKLNRPHMRQAYFAYLQNTPGSREAIYDCMVESGFTKKKNNPPEKPRNESPTSQKVEVNAQ